MEWGMAGKENFACIVCIHINLIHTFMCENHKSGVCFFLVYQHKATEFF